MEDLIEVPPISVVCRLSSHNFLSSHKLTGLDLEMNQYSPPLCLPSLLKPDLGSQRRGKKLDKVNPGGKQLREQMSA